MNFNSPQPRYQSQPGEPFMTPPPHTSSIPRATPVKLMNPPSYSQAPKSAAELKEMVFQKLDVANFHAGNAPSPFVSENHMSNYGSTGFSVGSPRPTSDDDRDDPFKKSKEILMSPVKTHIYQEEDDDNEDDYVTSMTSFPLSYEYAGEEGGGKESLQAIHEESESYQQEEPTTESIDELNSSLAHLSTDNSYISPSSLTSAFYNYLKNFKKMPKDELFEEKKEENESMKEKYYTNKTKDMNLTDFFNFSMNLLENSNKKVDELYHETNPHHKNSLLSFFSYVYSQKNQKNMSKKSRLSSIEEDEEEDEEREKDEETETEEDFIANFFRTSDSLSETKSDQSLHSFLQAHYGFDLLGQLYQESYEFNGDFLFTEKAFESQLELKLLD